MTPNSPFKPYLGHYLKKTQCVIWSGSEDVDDATIMIFDTWCKMHWIKKFALSKQEHEVWSSQRYQFCWDLKSEKRRLEGCFGILELHDDLRFHLVHLVWVFIPLRSINKQKPFCDLDLDWMRLVMATVESEREDEDMVN